MEESKQEGDSEFAQKGARKRFSQSQSTSSAKKQSTDFAPHTEIIKNPPLQHKTQNENPIIVEYNPKSIFYMGFFPYTMQIFYTQNIKTFPCSIAWIGEILYKQLKDRQPPGICWQVNLPKHLNKEKKKNRGHPEGLQSAPTMLTKS